MRKDRILLVIALSVLIFQLIGIAGLSRIDNQLNNEEKISLDIDINVSPKQISQKSPSPTPERKIVTSKTVEKKHMKNKRRRRKNYINLSKSEIKLLSKLLWFECRGECKSCQAKTASAVINRVTTQHTSLHNVIYAKNQFEPAPYIANSHISQKELEPLQKIVKNIMKNGPVIPEYVTYFREGRYHSWSGMVDYSHHCTTYFSYDVAIYNKVKNRK